MKTILSNLCKIYLLLILCVCFVSETIAQAPANDNCVAATILISGTSCANTAGTLINATRTLSGVPACGHNNSPDVWYQFVAKSLFPTITLSSVGAQLTTANPHIQLLNGSCGSFTSLACTAGTVLNVATAFPAGLTVGTTYYIRVTTNTNFGPVSSGSYGFNICVTDLNVDYSKAYINVTDGVVGGTINPGDVLEMRATIVVTGGGTTITNVSYRDTLKANAGFRSINNQIATRTNEGKVYRTYTDASDPDPGWRGLSGADTTFQINLGTGATNAVVGGGGTLTNTSRPSLFTVTCVIMATYRVTVTAANDTKINFGGGAFRFTASGVNYTINFPRDSLLVYETLAACSDAVSPGNLIGSAFNGTFGTLPLGSMPTAALQNGGPAAINTSYGYQPFSSSTPADYFYGVANNTSPTNSIIRTAVKTGGPTRVFGIWDITGDHTGATNTAKGNQPCNLTLPVSATNPCGYLLAINAAYRTDKVFEYTATGVCSETFYEVSAWFKNVCYRCGNDSMGRGPAVAGYIPTSPGDSSGVRPNIAMQIDGIDYYTTGELLYQGLGGTQTGSDTLNNWVRRSFVFKTAPNQTSFKVTFRNNAPGGGGNDWAIDDIGLRTCYPTMVYSPTNPIVFMGSSLTIRDTVRSYFNSYTWYKWQRKASNAPAGPAGPWADVVPASTGNATPVFINGQFQYTITYIIPGTMTLAANAGDEYRMVVASNAANLSNGCNFVPSTTFSLLPTDAPCALADTNYAVAPQTGSIDWNKLDWSKGRPPSCCESAQITYTGNSGSADGVNINITNDICIINLTLINKSTSSNQLFKTILFPGFNMQMNGHVRMGAPASFATDSCIFIAQGGGTVTVNRNTVIGYPADAAFSKFGSAPGTATYAKYRLRGDSLTYNNRAIANPAFTSITIDPLTPATPVRIINNTGAFVANALTFDSLCIGTIINPTRAILLGTNTLSNTNDNFGGIDVKQGSEFDLPVNAVNALGTKSSFNLRANATLRLGGSTNGIAGSNFPANFASYNLNPTSTVVFYGTAQTIPGSVNNINAYGNITLTGTGVKTASISNVNLAGNFYRTNGGHTYNANSGRVTFTSAINAQRYYADAGATPINFYDLTNNNTHISGLSVDSTIGVLNELELSPSTRTTLNTGDIIMRSSASRTSFVKNLGLTIPTIVYNSTYRFVVERHLFAQKAWRFLASPVQLVGTDATSPTVAAAWRESQSALSATGFGTAITGPTGPFGNLNQMDHFTQRGSMKFYNDAANVWTELTNTTSTRIANTQGYMVFVRGDRGAANTTAGAGTATNLRIKGQIRTGNQLFNVGANRFQSIGNPYAAQIDFRTIGTSGRVNVTNGFIIWKPGSVGLYGVGGYENYSLVLGNYRLNGLAGGTMRNFIESGEAIFVQNNTASSGSLTIREADKGTASNLVSRTGNANIVVPTLDISLLQKDTNEEFVLVDGASTSFDNSFSRGLDNDDVIKFTNTFDNLFITSNNKNLVVERRPKLTETDTIKLGITGTRVATYRFLIDPYVLGNVDVEAFLFDKFLNSTTALSLIDSNKIDFNITAAAASKAADRFMIVFKQVIPMRFIKIMAARNADKTATVTWHTENENNVNYYHIEHSMDGVNFAATGSQTPTANNNGNPNYNFIHTNPVDKTNWYRIKAFAVNSSRVQYSDIAKIGIKEIELPASISINPNPVTEGNVQISFINKPTGKYQLSVTNMAGQTIYTEVLQLKTNNLQKLIALGNVANGNYQLLVKDEAGTSKKISFLVK